MSFLAANPFGSMSEALIWSNMFGIRYIFLEIEDGKEFSHNSRATLKMVSGESVLVLSSSIFLLSNRRPKTSQLHTFVHGTKIDGNVDVMIRSANA